MAIIALCVDPDADRRSAFGRSLESALPRLGLTSSARDTGDALALWAVGPRSPIDVHVAHGTVSLVAGMPREGSAGRVTAEHLGTDQAWALPLELDGYFGALRWSREAGLSAASDLLGLFPVFYWHAGELLVVASSPDVFRHHPAFSRKVSEHALVAMLLLMHPVGGETLWNGVRRLGAGCTLRWRPGSTPQECRHVASADPPLDLPLSDCLRLLDGALRASIEADLPPSRQVGLLLSGGLDSRMVGGYLRESNAKVTALTLGLRRDVEVQCARRAAAALGFPQFISETPVESYSRLAWRLTQWEHGLNGSNSVVEWDLQRQTAALPPVVFTGYVMDAVVGGSHILWASRGDGSPLSFAAFWNRINRWGLSPDTVRGLLRPGLVPLVDEVVAGVEREYTGVGELESTRAWLFDLRHRQRFHVARGAWLLTFDGWPVLPVLDRRVLDVCRRIPAAALAERVAQKHLLMQRFQDLARVPLDRNALMPELLRPSLRHQLTQYVRDRGRSFARFPGHPVAPRKPRYHRVYDINGPGWRDIRRASDPFRRALDDYLEPGALDAVLPGPDTEIVVDHGITGPAGLKTLLGLQRWCAVNVYGERIPF